MPTPRDFLFGATAVVAGGLLLPAVATTAAAAPPSDADRQTCSSRVVRLFPGRLG